MSLPLGRTAILSPRNTVLLLSAFLLCATSAHAKGGDAAVPTTCANEIPVGVKVTKIPEAEQLKVTISEFSVSASKSAKTYDLAMRVKNGTDNWCITSFAFTYSLGDARGQEWIANEYPPVMEFKTQLDSPAPVKQSKSAPALNLPAHSAGMSPGRDEKRVVFDLYDYIQPRPTSYFDGFHLISADVKYCMGYMLAKAK
jgi:hypothetical protein